MARDKGRRGRPGGGATGSAFARASGWTARAAGRPLAFVAAAATVLLWGASGPVLHFSDTWQLVMNTVSSIVTFLMVFLIQNAQNRDNAAMHAKLDALLATLGADSRLIGIERQPGRGIGRIGDSPGAGAGPVGGDAASR